MSECTMSSSSHGRSVVSIKFSPNGQVVASAGADRVMMFHNTSNCQTVKTLGDIHEAGLNDCAWLTDSYIVTASDDGTIQINDFEAEKSVITFRLPKSFPMSLAINPVNKVVTCGDTEGNLFSYHFTCKESIQTTLAHSAAIVSVGYSHDGRELYTGSHDGLVRLWLNSQFHYCLRTIQPNHEAPVPISCVSYSPNEQYLLVSSLDNKHRLFSRSHMGQDPSELFVLRTYEGHQNQKYAISSTFLSHNQGFGRILSGSEDGRVFVWDAQTSKPIFQQEEHRDSIVMSLDSFSYCDEKIRLASGDSKGRVCLWSYEEPLTISSSPEITTYSENNSDNNNDNNIPTTTSTTSPQTFE